MSEDKPQNKVPENISEKTPENTPANTPANTSAKTGKSEAGSSGATSGSVAKPKPKPKVSSKDMAPENLEVSSSAKAKSADAQKTPNPQNASSPKVLSRLKAKFGRWYFVCLLVAFLGIVLLGVESYRFLEYPAQTEGKVVVVEINPGDSFDKVATRLENAGAISSKLKFKLYAKLRGEDSQIQAGVFEVYSNWTPAEVLYQLVYGKPTLERFTLREGLPWWEVAKRVEQAGLAKAEDFKEVIHDPDFLREMGIPFKSAEGFLYPETYFLRKPPEVLDKEQAKQIATRLINTFWQKSAAVWGENKPTGEELKTLLILASLVEKETGVPEERARVAGVYANRLRLNMLLQCDPTTIYGLGEAFNGNLRRKHLQDPANLYNTYKHAGLPPGPICSPGAAALQAALDPEEHKYLYFVAMGKNGSHYFNTNLKDHNRDVAKYIAELRKSRQASNQSKPASEQVAQTNSTMPEQPEQPANEQALANSTMLLNYSFNATVGAGNVNATGAKESRANESILEQSVFVNASGQEPSLEILEEELKLNQNATVGSTSSNNATNATGEASSLPVQNATLP